MKEQILKYLENKKHDYNNSIKILEFIDELFNFIENIPESKKL